jgi:hypothetical protein
MAKTPKRTPITISARIPLRITTILEKLKLKNVNGRLVELSKLSPLLAILLRIY